MIAIAPHHNPDLQLQGIRSQDCPPIYHTLQEMVIILPSLILGNNKHQGFARFRQSAMYIRDLVTQSLESGYLSLAAENHLRQLLSCKYDADDLQAFMKLQQAIMTGTVKQESRETARLAVEATSRKSLKRD